jgi:hypothetical protein
MLAPPVFEEIRESVRDDGPNSGFFGTLEVRVFNP